MGCVMGKKSVVEPHHVVPPVPPLSPPQVQPGLKLNLFTVSEEMSVEESERKKSEQGLYPVYRA